MSRLLVILVRVFGATCILIACAHIALGPRAIVGAIPVNATMDGEDRFFGALFLGFGAALLWCSWDLWQRRRPFGALLLVFFAGGVARLIAVWCSGWPHPLFVVLGALELLLPPIFSLWHQRAGGDSAHR